MGEAVTNARELYDRDATFRAGIAAWVAERRCDLRLVDLLLEYGLEMQAECARWAATEPDRPLAEDRGDEGMVCGPYPSCYLGDYYWYDCGSRSRTLLDSHDIPRKHFGRQVDYRTDKFKTAEDAILFLLDNWKPERRRGTRKRKK